MTNPAGFKTFADDVVLTASEINGYLMQGILVFDDSSARDTALSGSLAEGRFCYLKDTNVTYVYSGSAWVAVGGLAAAVISGTTGSPSTGTGKGGKALYTWTGNGSFTVGTAGLVRLLVVSGGGGANNTIASGGAGGSFDDVMVELPAGTYTVTIGAGGTYPGGNGGQSEVKLAGGFVLVSQNNGAYNLGNGSRSPDATGRYSDISGTSIGYAGAGYNSTNPGTYDSAYGGCPNSATVARANSGGGGSFAGSTGAGAAGRVEMLV